MTVSRDVLSPPGVRTAHVFRARGKELFLGRRTCVMGVINVTPDSFSDGGRFMEVDRAVEEGLRMVQEGAAILDIGGESTRPGASPVSAQEEWDRVGPVIEKLRAETDVLLSVDTSKAAVARSALAQGAEIINDVTALNGDTEMPGLVAETGAGVVLMHMLGTPRTMQESPSYADVAVEVRDFLERAAAVAEAAGVASDSILVDPGLGFGKTLEHNLTLLNRLGTLAELGKPILVGTSRKGFLGRLLDRPVDERLHGTAASVAAAILRGAHVVRVHDVSQMVQVSRVVDAILSENPAGETH